MLLNILWVSSPFNYQYIQTEYKAKASLYKLTAMFFCLIVFSLLLANFKLDSVLPVWCKLLLKVLTTKIKL